MKWEKSDIDNMIKYYQNKGPKYLSKLLNRDVSLVRAKASKMNLKFTQRYKNYDYKVNDITINLNEYSSYVLGFLWTDGYLLKNRYTVGIGILKEDMDNVEWIFRKTGNWYAADRKRKNRKKFIRELIAYNPNLLNKLIDLDFDKKSFISPQKIWNIIPDEYKKYFVRGVVDGDGCFYVNKKNYVYQFCISSSYEQDWGIFSSLFEKLNCKYTEKRIISNSRSKHSRIMMSSRYDISNFIKWLYSGYEKDNIGLWRKYEKSLLFIKNKEKTLEEKSDINI